VTRTSSVIRAIMGLALAATAALVVAVAPASAAPLTSASWSISKAMPGDTGVRYTWSFTTATTATISKVTFSVPSGTAGASLTVADVYGVPSGGTATLSGTTVTYTFSTPTSVSAGIPVLLAIDGFTNTSTAGTYASEITTYDNQATPAAVDTASPGPSATIASNTTGVTVVIARSTYFSNDTSSFTMLMDPGSNNDLTKVANLVVKTNAGGGYALSMKATALTTGTYTVPGVTSGVATGVASGSFTVNRWGFEIDALTGDAVGVRQSALATDGNYVGYTSGGETVVSASAPTNNDAVAVTNRVKIDYKQPAGTYSSTITYTVAPTY
jgi:hypothetical protein